MHTTPTPAAGDLAMRTAVSRLEQLLDMVGAVDPSAAKAFLDQVTRELDDSLRRYLAMPAEQQAEANAQRAARVRERAISAVAMPDVPRGAGGSKEALVSDLLNIERRHGLLWLVDGPKEM